MSQKKDALFQNDRFVSRVLRVALPMLVQQFVTNSVNLLDNIMVGQLGEAAISGVAVANRYFMVLVCALFGITAAAGIYIAQFHGAGKTERLRESYRFALLFSAVANLLFILPAIFAPLKIAAFFTADSIIYESVASYMPIAALASLPLLISMNSQNAMRVLGETAIPLKISLVTVCSNAFFNYVLIFGVWGFPRLGVAGAAWGTVLARLIELTLTLWALKRGDFAFKTKLSQIFQVPFVLSRHILRRGVPLMINEIGFAGGMAMLFKFYGTRGADVLAAMNILGTVADLFFILFSGMAVATTVVVGQALGANQLEEARSYAWRLMKFSLLVSTVFALLMIGSSFLFPRFYQVDESIRAMAGLFIRIYGIFYMAYVANAQCYFILRAGGAMRQTLLMDSAYFWFVNIPIVGAAAYLTDWPVLYIFLIGQFVDLSKVFISFYFVGKEKWLRNLAHEVEEAMFIP